MTVAFVLQYLILGIMLVVIPTVVGALLDSVLLVGDRRGVRILFRWTGGQMLLWAGFQLLCVPMVLKKRAFSEVVVLYSIYIVCLVLLSVGRWGYRRHSMRSAFRIVQDEEPKRGPIEWRVWVLWCVFACLLLLQLVQSVRLTYADWDDAFYVATSTITAEGNSMYRVLPYTGGETTLDARHGLAPFPVWIAYLSRISGMRAVSVAHVAVPMVLIVMTYGIYALLGTTLFKGNKEKLPLFLIFTELLVLFGNYSIYSAENFMIARSRQGKAALGNIVVPMLFLLLLLLLERLQQNKKTPKAYWILLLAVMITACLCSTMGAALAALLLGVAGLISAIAYRKGSLLVSCMLCCVPCVGYLLLYLVLR